MRHYSEQVQEPFHKPLEKITEDDLENLVSNKISEGLSLDYKSSALAMSSVQKEELCKDACAFANSAGGLLIAGITEADGCAVAVTGVDPTDTEAEALRLHQVLDSGTEPKLHGVKIHSVKLKSGKHVVIVSIPKSLNSPHRAKNSSRFPFRRSIGTRDMDISELKSAFVDAEELVTRIQNFRTGRIAQIANNWSVPPLETTSVGVLHFIPLTSFQSGTQFDVVSYCSSAPARLASFDLSGNQQMLAGFATFRGFRRVLDPLGHARRNGKVRSFVELQRNGIIEAVSASLLESNKPNEHLLSLGRFQRCLENALSSYLSIAVDLEIRPPYFVLISLLGTRDAKIHAPGLHVFDDAMVVGEQQLLFPEIIIEDATVDVREAIRPACELVWNCFGLQKPLYLAGNDWENWTVTPPKN